MAIIDYKISRFGHTGRHITATVNVFRGKVQNVTEPDWSSFVIPRPDRTVSRYVRVAKVHERTFEADVPRDMTRTEFVTKVRAYLNKKLIDWATANGHTVITEQQDVADYEAFSNETEI